MQGGVFLNLYNDSAIIIHYLFNYKIINGNKCGFPTSAKQKVVDKLNENHISYEEYCDDELTFKIEFKDNTFDEYLELAIKNLDVETKIKKINEIVRKQSKKELEKLVDELYARWK